MGHSRGYVDAVGLCVALLRAVNVGTTNRVRMDALRAVFHSAGYPDAVTHIQTGNVIFTPTHDVATTRNKIEQQIERDLGLAISVILRTGAELDALLSRNPLLDTAADAARLYVVFLSSEPSPVDVEAFESLSFADAQFAVSGREVFVRFAAGAGQSKLTGGLIEKKLRQRATMRNWAVTSTLAELSR